MKRRPVTAALLFVCAWVLRRHAQPASRIAVRRSQSCSLSRRHFVPDDVGQRGLRAARDLASRAVGRRGSTASLSGLPKTAPPLTSLTTSRSQPLRASLARARSSTEPVVVAGLGGEADDHRARRGPGRCRARGGCRGSGSARWLGAEPSAAFLILASLTAGRPEVGRGRGHHDGVGGRRRRPAPRARSWAVVSTRTTLTPAGSGSATLAATRVTSAPRAAAARASA